MHHFVIDFIHLENKTSAIILSLIVLDDDICCVCVISA